MMVEFSGSLWFWKGPAPFHFVTVPEDESAEIHEVAAALTYGWGMVPVTAKLGETEWTTSLFPKDGGYIVPIKDVVRRAEELSVDDPVTVRLFVDT
jgi:hypothetical protein